MILEKIATLLKTGQRNDIELAYQLSVSTTTSLWPIERGIKDLLYASTTQPRICFDNLPLGQLCLLLNQVIALSICDRTMERIPEQLCFMSGLVVLEIRDTPLLELPASLNELSQLKSLSITNTKITSLPTDIGKLGSLENLSLVGNSNLKSLPDELFELKGLKVLRISEELLSVLEGREVGFEVVVLS